MLRLARGQTERGQNALQVIVAVVFDLDGSPFLPVMNLHAGPEMLLQSILQIVDRGGGGRHRARLPFPPRPRRVTIAPSKIF